MRESNDAPDIYFDSNYGRLYESIEHGIAANFVFKCKYGIIHHNFIKRQIPFEIDGKQYYDLITPYGYGGPIVIESTDESCREELITSFANEFALYCSDNSIVSEFVRFNPVVGNAIDFKLVYNTEYMRNTVGTDLANYPDFLYQEYSKGCRKNVKKSLEKGVKVAIIEAPESLDEFKDVYYSTMDRNNAVDYYYFQDDYFYKCLNFYKDHILLAKTLYEEQVIAAGLYFTWDKIVHIHLSGTLNEYLNLSPAYILRYGVTQWALEHGYKLIHHGGGRTNNSEDSLYKFKKQFGKNTGFPFYIGKKIWNEEVYKRLCNTVRSNESNTFFPAYRTR